MCTACAELDKPRFLVRHSAQLVVYQNLRKIKAPKPEIRAAKETLFAIMNEYKRMSGADLFPGLHPMLAAPVPLLTPPLSKTVADKPAAAAAAAAPPSPQPPPPPTTTHRLCVMCKEIKLKADFSKSQLKKSAGNRKCKACCA